MLAWHGEHVRPKIMLAAPAQDARHLIFVIPTDGKTRIFSPGNLSSDAHRRQYSSMVAPFAQKFIIFFWIRGEKTQAHLMDLI